MIAQTITPKLQGEFYLRGVTEVGSGFKFNPDHTFEFFFMYGALDRFAKGKWARQGDTIILNNDKKPPVDFKLLQSKKTTGKEITIKIIDANKMILRNVYGSVKSGDSVYRSATNDKGEMSFADGPVEKISLIHEFWPDRFSVFDVESDKNYFEFAIEPWIADVQFVDFLLVLKDGNLTGKHPILDKKEYQYIKAK